LFPALRILVGATVLMAVAGCSPFPFLNAVAPGKGYTVQTGIAYGSLPRQKLDLYLPPPAAIRAPVVIFFYGGGWEEGSRGEYRFVGSALAAKGIAVAIPDYRVYPEVVFPSFIEDGALAAKWVQDHAGEFGADPQRLYLMGHSAGAHIAAMLSLNGKYLEAAGADRRAVAGLIGLSGPYDFLPLKSARLKEIFGDPAPRLTQPIEFVDSGAPPALLVTGSADETVNPGNSKRLAETLRASGVKVEYRVYPDIGHGRTIAAFSRPLSAGVPVMEEVVEFIAAATGVAAGQSAECRPDSQRGESQC
jgi:acetyl esterase/lipase